MSTAMNLKNCLDVTKQVRKFHLFYCLVLLVLDAQWDGILKSVVHFSGYYHTMWPVGKVEIWTIWVP